MKPVRLSRFVALVVAALVGASAVAAVGLARSDHATRTSHAASTIAGRHMAHVAASKAAGLKVVYYRASSKVAPGDQVADVNVLCPKRYPRALSGIFDSADDSKVFLTASAPGTRGSRSWTIVAFNTNTTPQRVTTGVVCAK
jgi:hypothetical protein